ncbi:MAG: septum site-determining protein MinC, partial [Halochromatium sp.]
GGLPVTGQTSEPQVGIETGSHLIDRPVRSGQRVYAAGGDLTVLAPVNSGAELMADGNIHVYAPMRGRAMAGLHGNTNARIFCADLQAELVSIAGHYRVSDKIPATLKGHRIQIFLDHEVLRIEPL